MMMNGERERYSPVGSSQEESATPPRSSSPIPHHHRNRRQLDTSPQQESPNKTFILPQTVQFGFHDVCSEQIRIVENGLKAEKKDPSLHYAHGVAYSALPLRGTAEFEVAMTDYGTGWSGTLKLGIAKYKTGCSFQVNKMPRYSPEAADHCVWSSDKVHNRLRSYQKGAKEKPYGAMDLDNLRMGDKLGLRLSHDGILTFFVNGKCQGVAAEKIYEKGHDVYVVVDHYANCKATVITRAGKRE
jgi:neuralized-like protein 4